MTTVIHSLKVAQAIIDAGQSPVTVEPNRNKAGKLVFIFESSPLVTEILDRFKRTQTG